MQRRRNAPRIPPTIPAIAPVDNPLPTPFGFGVLPPVTDVPELCEVDDDVETVVVGVLEVVSLVVDVKLEVGVFSVEDVGEFVVVVGCVELEVVGA